MGQTFTAPDGAVYRPLMFLTLTLPSYGPTTPGTGTPAHPVSYDYRRAALDALHFPKLVDRFWQNLRRSAGYRVQYFAAVEPQKRLAPHLHAAIRGAIPRATLRQVVKATYVQVQVWWPKHDHPVYTDPERYPAWDGSDYVDEQTGVILATWEEALDQADRDADAKPAHVMRSGTQTDMRGMIAPSPDADRAVRYLVKYLTKSVAEIYADPDQANVNLERHIDRLHAEVQFLPCSLCCANWLRFGVQPANSGPGMRPGWCPSKAHDGGTLVSAAAASSSPANGPAKPCPSTAPTGPPSSAKLYPRPGSSPPSLNGSPLMCCPRMGSRGSCGPTRNRTRSCTPGSSSPPCRTAPLESPIRNRQDVPDPCGQPFGNSRAGALNVPTSPVSASPITAEALSLRGGRQG